MADLVTVATRDGLALAAWRYPTALSMSRPRVIVVHGYAEHSGRYERVAEALGAAGYECHLFDLRGHGRSEGPRGHVGRFADYLDDLDRIVGWAGGPGRCAIDPSRGDGRNQPPRLPLFAVAHSLGGLIALEYVRRRHNVFDVVAAISPFLAPAFTLPPMAEQLASVVSRVLPSYRIKSRLAPRWLSHDAAVVDAYSRDPLVFDTLTLGWWREVRSAQETLFRGAGDIRLPVLFMVGDADRVADWRRSTAVFERLGSADRDLEIYPGLFHEVLNEVRREQVLHDLVTWLDRRSDRTIG